MVTDPQLVRELLVTHHDALVRWERGIRVFGEVHGHSVLIAEGGAWRDKRHALQPGFMPKAAQAAAREEVKRVLGGRAPTAQTRPLLRYLAQTLEETLRLYPAAPILISRRALRPIALGGWQLPARTLFMLPLQLMHDDPRWFSEPHAFRPERFDEAAPAVPRGAYMPFGTGPRVCLGQHLATTEMTVIDAMLLQRFELAVPAGMAAPRPVLNVTLRPDRPLHLGIAAISPDPVEGPRRDRSVTASPAPPTPE